MYVECWQKLIWAVAFAAAAVLGVASSAQEAEYVGQKTCKICHNKESEGKQWTKWKAMNHAHALETLSNDKAKEFAAAEGLKTPPEESPECLRCHVTAYDVEKKVFNPKIAKEDGVQCESCHGPSSEHLAFGKKMLTAKEIPDDMPRHTVRPDKNVCLKCHNDESPAWNPDLYTLEDGTKTFFDFDQAFAKIEHYNPKKPRVENPKKQGAE